MEEELKGFKERLSGKGKETHTEEPESRGRQEDYGEMIEEYVESGMPVFIKVDRYEDMLSIVDEMKSFHSALTEVRRIIDEIEAVRSSAFSLLDRINSKLDERIKEIDSFLTRPKGLKLEKKSKEARDIDEALSRLKEELESLRKEIGSVES